MRGHRRQTAPDLFSELALPLLHPPEHDEAFRLDATNRWCIIWGSQQHRGFYHVVSFGLGNDHTAEATHKPVAWSAIDDTLKGMHFHIDNVVKATRMEGDTSNLEEIHHQVCR